MKNNMKYRSILILAILGIALALSLAACGGGGGGDSGSMVTPDPNRQQDEMQITPDPGGDAAGTWRGLTVAPENRCAPYDRGDYPHPQSVEQDIVRSLGGVVYGPYTGRCFGSTSETDIEHIVATSEAHDSGLCTAGATTRRAFARDLDNLTLAAPAVNRSKGGRDAGEWLPDRNRCWFAGRVVAVKRQYRLTVDRQEMEVLERVLSGCTSLQMEAPALC